MNPTSALFLALASSSTSPTPDSDDGGDGSSSSSSSSDEKSTSTPGGRWTHEEHVLFIQGFKLFGKDWKRISKVVGTRNNIQCRTHAQKYFRSRPDELAALLAKKKEMDQQQQSLLQRRYQQSQQQLQPQQPAQNRPLANATATPPATTPVMVGAMGNYTAMPMLQQPAAFLPPAASPPHAEQQLNERFLNYLRQRASQVPGPLFVPFM